MTTDGTTTPQSLAYEYDEQGNITRVNDTTPGSSEDMSYKYDFLDRLTAMMQNNNPNLTCASYTYGQPTNGLGGTIGNMTAKAEGLNATPTPVEYSAEHIHAPSQDLTCDKNGSLIGFGWLETWQYNVEDQMVSDHAWWPYNVITDYLYDGAGNLLRRDMTLPGFAANKYVDVEELYSEQVTGCNAGANSTTRYYRAFGRIIASRTTTALSSDVRYYVADQLGSTNTLLTSAGAVYGSGMKYWPFGAQRAGSTPDRGYTGQLSDTYSTIGAYYYHARFYSTTLAHFTSADPVGLSSRGQPSRVLKK